MTQGIVAYNPALLEPKEIAAQFVARGPLLQRLLTDLLHDGSHVLVVGPRGMGKTMLLRAIYANVLSDSELSRQWFPIVFPEEQYNVRRLSDFWVNCLDAMADTFDTLGLPGEARRLDEVIAGLPNDEGRRSDLARTLLSEHAHHRRVLLLLDNLDLVLDRIKLDEQWALRAALQDRGGPRLIAATAGDPTWAREYQAPFYDFFAVESLRPLTFDESMAVLRQLATRAGNTAVLQTIEAAPARFRTLHTLTGGNPRTLVLLYTVVARDTDASVEQELEQVLDLVTPLYKARFEELPKQSQQVLDALAVAWDPRAAGVLADDMGLPVNAVSTNLDRLAQAGIVEKVELADTTKLGFQVSERFFNVWYLMRMSRRMRTRLKWLARFLEVWHGSELPGHAATLLGRTGVSAELELAMADVVADASLREALRCDAVDRLLDHPDRTALDRLLAESPGDGVASIATRKRKLRGTGGDPAWKGAFGTLEERERIRDGDEQSRADAERLEMAVTIAFGPDMSATLRDLLAHGDLADPGDVQGAGAGAIRREGDLVRVAKMCRLARGVDDDFDALLRSANSPQAQWLDEIARKQGQPQHARAAQRRAWSDRGNGSHALAAWHFGGVFMLVPSIPPHIAADLFAAAASSNGAAAWSLAGVACLRDGAYEQSVEAFKRASLVIPEFGNALTLAIAIAKTHVDTPAGEILATLEPDSLTASLRFALDGGPFSNRVGLLDLAAPSVVRRALERTQSEGTRDLRFEAALSPISGFVFAGEGSCLSLLVHVQENWRERLPDSLCWVVAAYCSRTGRREDGRAFRPWIDEWGPRPSALAATVLALLDDDAPFAIENAPPPTRWDDPAFQGALTDLLRADAADAVAKFLDGTPWGDRMLPLRAAAHAIAARDVRTLLSVAPEVRKPAEEIVEAYWPPGVPRRQTKSRAKKR